MLHPPHHPRWFLVEVHHVWRCSIYPFSSGFYQRMKRSQLPLRSPCCGLYPPKYSKSVQTIAFSSENDSGRKNLAEELDGESCCPNPLDEYRHHFSVIPLHVNRSFPTSFCCSLYKPGWLHRKVSSSIKNGSGLKVWEERNEKHL